MLKPWEIKPALDRIQADLQRLMNDVSNHDLGMREQCVCIVGECDRLRQALREVSQAASMRIASLDRIDKEGN